MKSRENGEKKKKKSHTYKHLLDRPKCSVKEKEATFKILEQWLLLLPPPVWLMQTLSDDYSSLSPWKAGRNGACNTECPQGLHNSMGLWDNHHVNTWNMICDRPALPLSPKIKQKDTNIYNSNKKTKFKF